MENKLYERFAAFEKVQNRSFCFCAVLFLIGCIFGATSSGFIGNEDALFDVLLSISEETVNPFSFSSLFLHYTRYCFAAILLGFSSFGIIMLPILVAFKGYSYAFSLSVLIRCAGDNELLFLLILFGTELLLSLPFFLAAVSEAILVSKSIFEVTFKKCCSVSIFTARHFCVYLVCVAANILIAVFAYFLIPAAVGIILH